LDRWRRPVGFVVKSAFWLGLVYYAMPFDSEKPNAAAPMTAAAAYSGYPLGTYASVVNSTLRQKADDWRSAIEVAASLCARDCPGAAPAKPRSNSSPTLKERAALERRLSPEKSD
jgi:hypothetical protein